MNLKNTSILRKVINDKLNNWNERSGFKIKGVGNLSRSDLDTLEFYLDTIDANGSYTGRLMSPYGGVRDVLIAYGLFEW